MKEIFNKKMFIITLVAFLSISVFGGAYAEDNLESPDDEEIEDTIIEEAVDEKLDKSEMLDEIKEVEKPEVIEEVEKNYKLETKGNIETNDNVETLTDDDVKLEVVTKKTSKTVPTKFERIFIEGTRLAGTYHEIRAEVTSSKVLLYRFYEKDMITSKRTIIQDYSEKSSANWLPRKKGDYWYGVEVKEINSKNDSDISKEAPIRIKPSIPAEIHSLDIIGTNEATTPHKIVANANAPNHVLYRFHIKDSSTGKWTTIQDYSKENTVVWTPEKSGDYEYGVNVKDINSLEDREDLKTRAIKIEALKPARLESLELQGNRAEKTDHVLVAKGTSTNDVLYQFYIKDESTGVWTVIQKYSTKNTVNWAPETHGKYIYSVRIKDERSERVRDDIRSIPVTINPPVIYNTTNYDETLEEALKKQTGTKSTPGGGWTTATKNDIKKYLDPSRFLQFKPKGNIESGKEEATVTSKTLNVRSGPGTSYEVIGSTQKGAIYSILSEENGWYMIKLNGSHGWVSGTYINIKRSNTGETQKLASVEIQASSLNVRKEPNGGSQLLTSVSKGDVYIVLDQKNGWYQINAGGKTGWISGNYVKNVNDVPKEMYQFMVLSGQVGVTTSQMNQELRGMGILEGRAAAFIEGSRKYNVNELYLMSHALLESGRGTSKLARGVWVDSVRGKSVPRRMVYNMYGIGAVDSAPLKGGSERAYEEGWFTPELAITEGAHWISESYINHPVYKQDTLYKMRFYPDNPGHYHKYATDVGWAFKQIGQIDNIMEYAKNMEGIVLRFDIPLYKETVLN